MCVTGELCEEERDCVPSPQAIVCAVYTTQGVTNQHTIYISCAVVLLFLCSLLLCSGSHRGLHKLELVARLGCNTCNCAQVALVDKLGNLLVLLKLGLFCTRLGGDEYFA